jgi:hypothetical protein
MSLQGYAPLTSAAKAFLNLAEKHALLDSLVPSLTKSGQIGIGVVCENLVSASKLGSIFGHEFGPFIVDTWGQVQVVCFTEIFISRPIRR